MRKSWPCYECDEGFESSAELQQHLTCHDEVCHSLFYAVSASTHVSATVKEKVSVNVYQCIREDGVERASQTMYVRKIFIHRVKP